MSVKAPPPASIPLREEEEEDEMSNKELRALVKMLRSEQKKALKETLNPSKPDPIMIQTVGFETVAENWEQRSSDIDSQEEEFQPAQEQTPQPMMTPQILQRKEFGYQDNYQRWLDNHELKKQQKDYVKSLSSEDSLGTIDGYVGMDMLLKHLCDEVLKMKENSVIYNQDEVKTLVDLVTMSKEDIFGIEDRDMKRISKVDARLLQHLTWWYAYVGTTYIHQEVPSDYWWNVTNEDFEKFRRTRVPMMSRSDMNMKGSTGSNEETEALTLFNKSLTLNVSQFPEFKGVLENWLFFKRKFLAMADTHGLGVIFQTEEEKFIPGSQAARLYKKKCQFMYSVFTQKLHGGTCILAIRKHQTKQDARKAFQEMVSHYESPENLMVISQKCMTIIEGLVLTHTYTGGVSAYTAKLENTYMDLEYCTKRENLTLKRKPSSYYPSKILDSLILEIHSQCPQPIPSHPV